MILTEEFIDMVREMHSDTQSSMYNHVLITICGISLRNRLILALTILLGTRFFLFINRDQVADGGKKLVDESIIRDVMLHKRGKK